MESQQENLLWLDLEMTGLDPDRERIIEIATVVTDSNLKVIAEGPDLVIFQPDKLLNAMDAWNTKHHGASGLINGVRSSTITTEKAEAQTLEFVAQHCERNKTPLAGNSIHQDRAFLVRYMPKFADFLHYRNVDVSTIKELVRRWYPKIYEKRPRKTGDHRAKGDILDSIAELAFYRREVFCSE